MKVTASRGGGKGFTLRGYSLFGVINFPAIFERGKAAAAGVTAGICRPETDRVFKFEQVVDAHRHMGSNTQQGKIVVEVS